MIIDNKTFRGSHVYDARSGTFFDDVLLIDTGRKIVRRALRNENGMYSVDLETGELNKEDIPYDTFVQVDVDLPWPNQNSRRTVLLLNAEPNKAYDGAWFNDVLKKAGRK